MTHNTREGIEEISTTLDLDTFKDEWGRKVIPRDVVDDLLAELHQTHHHQLQKARQDWLREEIGRLEGMKVARYKWDYKEGDGEYKDGYNQALDDTLTIINSIFKE